MAMLLFYAGENRFAIACSSIFRIVPNVLLQQIPDHDPFVAGLMFLGREPIPVVDFCQIIEKRATRPFMNSRIILLKDAYSGSNRCIGLLGEKVDEIIDLSPEQFDQRGFYFEHFHYLDKGFTDEKGMIHFINLEEFFQFLFANVFHDSGKDIHGS